MFYWALLMDDNLYIIILKLTTLLYFPFLLIVYFSMM